MYASWNGFGWSTQTIVKGGTVTSLALDKNDNPHILCDGALLYSSWTGTNWSTRETGITEAFYPAFALDADDNPHVAYVSGDELKYASLTEAGWVTQAVDNLPIDSGLSSLVFSKDNTAYLLYHVHCCFQDNSTGQKYQSLNIKLASLTDSMWSIQTVPLPPPLFDKGNLVLDSKGNLHFVYKQVRYRSSEDVNLLVTLLYVIGTV